MLNSIVLRPNLLQIAKGGWISLRASCPISQDEKICENPEVGKAEAAFKLSLTNGNLNTYMLESMYSPDNKGAVNWRLLKAPFTIKNNHGGMSAK